MKTTLYTFNGLTEYHDTVEAAKAAFEADESQYKALGVEVIDNFLDVKYINLIISSNGETHTMTEKQVSESSEAVRMLREVVK